MYIPFNLRMLRILGKDRIEPCSCGHYHRGKEVILPSYTTKEMCEAILKVLDVIDNVPTE